MMAGWYNFTIEQGATVNFELTYKDSSGNPIDLTDYSARMQIKNARGGNQTYISLSSNLATDGTGLNMSGSTETKSPVSGSIGVYISAHSSSRLSFSEGYYDIELVSGSQYPYVIRLLEGKVKLSKEVTTST
jgi:hypothetical protein